ncbi:MAG: DsbE family thiol:disulfide interchange protein [Betaproteobacteria bacterium]|jgi:cytochrome c biogenesis protein CcmG, thiol:disulfide interchange protein DsbE|nr:DsbE family thiol:disulfide interchange protein [Rhodocyclales bacterium]
MKRFLIPLAGFFVLVIFLAIGLTRDPRDLPSPLKDKPAPSFTLPQLADPDKTFSPADMKGKVWLLNVWSSWCVSCRAEHPVLVDFARQSKLPIVGLSYKEVRGDSEIDAGKLSPDAELKLTRQRSNVWLARRGDPYSLVALDLDGRVGIDYGVYGVPETYVIDKAGMIRMKHTGPITPESLKTQILPLVAELSK